MFDYYIIFLLNIKEKTHNMKKFFTILIIGILATGCSKKELKPVENMSDTRDDNKSIMQSSLKQ